MDTMLDEHRRFKEELLHQSQIEQVNIRNEDDLAYITDPSVERKENDRQSTMMSNQQP